MAVFVPKSEITGKVQDQMNGEVQFVTVCVQM